MQAPGTPNGGFVYRLDDETWQWSDDMYHLFGFEPGEVVPSTDLIARHLTKSDNDRLLALLEAAANGTVPVSGLHRIHAADRDRVVVTTLSSISRDCDRWTVRGVTSDVTVDLQAEATRRAQAQISSAIDSHRIVDQATGIIMLAYSLSSDQAFQLIRWLSQRNNTKLRIIAERVIEAAGHGDLLSNTTGYDLDRLFSDAVVTDSTPSGGSDRLGQRFSTEVELRHDSTRLTVRGVVDLSATPSLAKALAAAGSLRPRQNLIIDLSGVTHLAPTGLYELDSFQHRARSLRRRRVTVIHPREHPKWMAALSNRDT